MTVDELLTHLQTIAADGGGERIVRMGDPRTNDYVEVTGLWIPQDPEGEVDLEAVDWAPLQSPARPKT